MIQPHMLVFYNHSPNTAPRKPPSSGVLFSRKKFLIDIQITLKPPKKTS